MLSAPHSFGSGARWWHTDDEDNAIPGPGSYEISPLRSGVSSPFGMSVGRDSPNPHGGKPTQTPGPCHYREVAFSGTFDAMRRDFGDPLNREVVYLRSVSRRIARVRSLRAKKRTTNLSSDETLALKLEGTQKNMAKLLARKQQLEEQIDHRKRLLEEDRQKCRPWARKMAAGSMSFSSPRFGKVPGTEPQNVPGPGTHQLHPRYTTFGEESRAKSPTWSPTRRPSLGSGHFHKGLGPFVSYRSGLGPGEYEPVRSFSPSETSPNRSGTALLAETHYKKQQQRLVFSPPVVLTPALASAEFPPGPATGFDESVGALEASSSTLGGMRSVPPPSFWRTLDSVPSPAPLPSPASRGRPQTSGLSLPSTSHYRTRPAGARQSKSPIRAVPWSRAQRPTNKMKLPGVSKRQTRGPKQLPMLLHLREESIKVARSEREKERRHEIKTISELQTWEDRLKTSGNVEQAQDTTGPSVEGGGVNE